MNYIFLYGSLLFGSRVPLEPARIDGVQRGWFVPIPEDHDTGLGLVLDEQLNCNGCLQPTSVTELRTLDHREHQHGYRRTRVPLTRITSALSLTPRDRVWAYCVASKHYPTQECPIAQSYLDVVLSGFLKLGESFAREFLRTTKGWEYPWINDRDEPRYRRAENLEHELIDLILAEEIPEFFSQRVGAH